MNRALLGVEVLGAHRERAAGDPAHPGGGSPRRFGRHGLPGVDTRARWRLSSIPSGVHRTTTRVASDGAPVSGGVPHMIRRSHVAWPAYRRSRDGIEGRHASPELADAAGRAAHPPRAAARAGVGARRGSGRAGAEIARVIDCALAGSLPEELARSIVRNRVLERIVAELRKRRARAPRDSRSREPETIELTERVLASDETQQALRHVASSPEPRRSPGRRPGSPKRCRRCACVARGSTIGSSSSSGGAHEPSALSTAGSRRARSRSQPTRP